MGRPQKLDELWASGLTRAAKNSTSNEAGQMTSLDILSWSDENATNSNDYITETREYNCRHQLTKIVSSKNTLDYTYSATQNNGKITKMNKALTGEEVNYAYGELQRLISASTTGTQWGLSWTFDGFGNRLNQSVTKGTGPPSILSVNWANNPITTSGFGYDANGNMIQTLDYLGWYNRTHGTRLNSMQLGTAIIIHELRHQYSAPKPSDAETVQTGLEVYVQNACIK